MGQIHRVIKGNTSLKPNNMKKSQLKQFVREELQKVRKDHYIFNTKESNKLVDPNPLDDIPTVKIDIDEDNNMILKLSYFFHNGDNGKIALLKDNLVLQNLLMKAIQVESQKMFRKTVHGIIGIPYGLKEND